ncbi:hypothetical protein, partial [Burkholderia sp. Bp8986]|uniref:hypothetical protein n=1 Tax=Burkholderia sp. Bp8986 TaxID=2184550 RepID=UPI001C896697
DRLHSISLDHRATQFHVKLFLGRNTRLAELGNVCELLINVVISNMPTLLSGMVQKWNVAGYRSPMQRYAADSATGEEAGPYLVV